MHGVAACILNLIWNDERYASALNVVHPQGVAWDTTMTDVQDALEHAGKPRLTLVPFIQWIKLLEQRYEAGSNEDLKRIVGDHVFTHSNFNADIRAMI